MKNIFFVFIALFLLGCPDMGTYYSSYKIINGTTHAVELRFYKGSIASDERNFVFKAATDGEGLVLERTLKTFALETNSPIEAFKADSIALVFNKERVEGHKLFVPAGNSMLFDYERNGEQFTYTITEENYNNAIPCDGSCN
jgi:hypothetical protein